MIYFDNGATTFPKPPAVLREMTRCMREYCGNSGRSGHPMALAAAEAIYDTRAEIAAFFGSEKPENVVFTQNATAALNLALFGTARAGDRFLTSDLEHNSVLRPLAALSARRGVTVETVHALGGDDRLLSDMEMHLRRGLRAVILTHLSNICPRLLPIGKIGALCRRYHALFIVDAAQSAGIYDIHMKRDGISILCAPGHKGLYGPQGTGFCLFAEDFDFSDFSPSLFGGNGKNSRLRQMGMEPPDSYEAGTLATPSLVGLREGVRYIRSVGRENILAHETALYRRLRGLLLSQKGVKLYLPEAESGTLLLLGFDKMSPSEVAALLGDRGICVRAGLHCAPTAHDALGTGGDALRVTFSAFNTERETEQFAAALEEICG